MTPNSNFHDENRSTHSQGVIQRDRFELLSAYLDGEVTAAERKQVETWLEEDPTVQRLYRRLLSLREGMQSMPIPSSAPSADALANQVFAQVERRSRRRLWLWGSVATVLVGLGGVTAWVLGERSFTPQMATSPTPDEAVSQQPTATEEPPLLIALDEPVVEIPKAPVSPEKPAVELPDNVRDNVQ